MERVFRSLKTEWIPTLGYRTAQKAQCDISHFFEHRYNWIRPHQFNGGLAPAWAEEKNSMSCSGLVDHYILLPTRTHLRLLFRCDNLYSSENTLIL